MLQSEPAAFSILASFSQSDTLAKVCSFIVATAPKRGCYLQTVPCLTAPRLKVHSKPVSECKVPTGHTELKEDDVCGFLNVIHSKGISDLIQLIISVINYLLQEEMHTACSVNDTD